MHSATLVSKVLCRQSTLWRWLTWYSSTSDWWQLNKAINRSRLNLLLTQGWSLYSCSVLESNRKSKETWQVGSERIERKIDVLLSVTITSYSIRWFHDLIVSHTLVIPPYAQHHFNDMIILPLLWLTYFIWMYPCIRSFRIVIGNSFFVTSDRTLEKYFLFIFEVIFRTWFLSFNVNFSQIMSAKLPSFIPF